MTERSGGRRDEEEVKPTYFEGISVANQLVKKCGVDEATAIKAMKKFDKKQIAKLLLLKKDENLPNLIESKKFGLLSFGDYSKEDKKYRDKHKKFFSVLENSDTVIFDERMKTYMHENEKDGTKEMRYAWTEDANEYYSIMKVENDKGAFTIATPQFVRIISNEKLNSSLNGDDANAFVKFLKSEYNIDVVAQEYSEDDFDEETLYYVDEE